MIQHKSALSVSSLFLCAVLAAVGLTACNANGSKTGEAGQQTDTLSAEDSVGFRSLFNGHSLDGWQGDTAFWHVVDGAIVGEETAQTSSLLKANTFLIWTGGQPADFELTAQYQISSKGNSGVQYRSAAVEGVPFGLKGYQLDIDGPNQYTGQNYEERLRTILAFPGQKVVLPPVSGPRSDYAKGNVWRAAEVEDTIVDAAALKALYKPGWNSLRIVAKDNHLQHYINDVLVCDITDNDTTNRKAKGVIGLQLHAGHIMRVAFKDIRLKTL